MAKFKLGDKARIVGFHVVYGNGLIGKTCRIVGTGGFEGVTSGHIFEYAILIDDTNKRACAHANELEPIIDVGSWDEIETSIGWNPTKIKEPENER